jgi:GT2 family glycosyltransferase
MTLAFPDPPAPDLTVLLVVHNAWDWTRKALEALRDHTPPRYQLVAVDNASTDGAAEGLDELTGATVLHNATNVGFGPAANQAALHARARHLVLLNSDALVHPGWLEALVEVADADPTVAAVGGRLLNLDGTLQEAGAIVWRDGSVTNYGDGDDAARPEYTFRRDVDHISAALLLIRRSAFVDAGGFDPVYAPAYLEDVDLCFSLHARGFRTVYEPAATATHVRWASGDRSQTERLLARNLPTFTTRWQTELAARPHHPAHHDRRLLLAGRDAMCEARVLVVADAVDQAVSSTLDAIAHHWPSARRTLLTADANAAGLDGVEVIDADVLAERALHYDVVLADADAPPVVSDTAGGAEPWRPVGGVLVDAGLRPVMLPR